MCNIYNRGIWDDTEIQLYERDMICKPVQEGRGMTGSCHAMYNVVVEGEKRRSKQ